MQKRKRLRLKEYDYSLSGSYFITICSIDKSNIFCSIDEDIINSNYGDIDFSKYIKYTKIGMIVRDNIKYLNNEFDSILIDNYVIMPSHIHLLINLLESNKTSLQKLIMSFKRSITINCKRKIWQRSFYDRIIRNKKEFDKINEYIIYNSFKWKLDEYYNIG